jgi:hypothetical protein
MHISVNLRVRKMSPATGRRPRAMAQLLDAVLRLLQGVEDLSVEEVFSEAIVETFTISVPVRPPQLDVSGPAQTALVSRCTACATNSNPLFDRMYRWECRPG